MTKVLKSGDNIRLNTWTGSVASIGNIWEAYLKHAEWIAAMGMKGHPIPEGSDLSMAEWCARNTRNGGEDVWSIYSGCCITNQKGYYEEQKRIFDAAVVIENGEVVEYCGRKWKLTSTRRRSGVEQFPEYSNPFKWTLVEEKVAA